MKFSTVFEGIHEKIAALRAKTTARGATQAEADAASAKADELEVKHGLKPAPQKRQTVTVGGVEMDVGSARRGVDDILNNLRAARQGR
jgi:hypothetical protein